MQQNRLAARSGKHKTSAGERVSLGFAPIIFAVAMLAWLFSTSHILGQLELKPSRLILTTEGCSHLKQYNIIPQPILDSDRCMLELPFRQNLFNDGGIAKTGLGSIRIPECQLVSYLPLAEPHWWAERWPLVLWEATCTAFLLFSMWLLGKATDRREH